MVKTNIQDLRLALVSAKLLLQLIQKIKNYRFIENERHFWLPELSIEEATGLSNPPVYGNEVIESCHLTLPAIETLLKKHEQLLKK